jgi:hypothetical protein
MEEGGPGVRTTCPDCKVEVAVNADGRIRTHGGSRTPTITTDTNGRVVNAMTTTVKGYYCQHCANGHHRSCIGVPCQCSLHNHRPDDDLAARMRKGHHLSDRKASVEQLASEYREVCV